MTKYNVCNYILGMITSAFTKYDHNEISDE